MIYLDHNATSPLRPEVLEAMRPWFGVPANPASPHRLGQRAAMAIDQAREEVARLVGGNPDGVVFTSGATEANHLYLRGEAMRLWRDSPGLTPRIALSAIEHPCVHAAVVAAGFETVLWPVSADGRVSLLPPEGAHVLSLMAANHETGVLQPVLDAWMLAKGGNARIHCDATQAAGKVRLNLSGFGGVVLSSHKIGGPAGVGALILPDGEPFPGLLTGGAQERGRRAGTVNVAGVVGFAAACREAMLGLDDTCARWAVFTQRLERAIHALGGRVIGGAPRLPNTTCAIFPGLRGETLVQALDIAGFCLSSGAACSSGSLEPSPVLQAMGESEPAGGLRFSWGWSTTAAELDALVSALPVVIERVRQVAAWETVQGF